MCVRQQSNMLTEDPEIDGPSISLPQEDLSEKTLFSVGQALTKSEFAVMHAK